MTPSHFSDLQKVFKFTDDDLAAYREARLGNAYLVKNKGILNGRAVVWTSGFWLLVTVVIMFVTSGTPPFFRLVLMIWLIWCLWKILHKQSELRSDIRDGRVIVTSGSIHKEIKSDAEGDSVYKVYIRQQSFTVSQKQYEALQPDVTYCVYFLPRSNTILAVEPVPQVD